MMFILLTGIGLGLPSVPGAFAYDAWRIEVRGRWRYVFDAYQMTARHREEWSATVVLTVQLESLLALRFAFSKAGPRPALMGDGVDEQTIWRKCAGRFQHRGRLAIWAVRMRRKVLGCAPLPPRTPKGDS